MDKYVKKIFFYSTFSLSSLYFIQLFLSLLTDSTRVLSLFFLQIKFPHPYRSLHLLSASQIKSPPSPLVWRLHCRQSEAAIATTDLKLASGFIQLFDAHLSHSADLKHANLKPPSLSLIWSSSIWSYVVLYSSRRQWLVEFSLWLIYWVGVLLKILILSLSLSLFGICWRNWWLWL